MTDHQRIKFAYYDPDWVVEGGDKELLKSRAQSVVAVDVSDEMDGHLFCPECCTNVTKSPKLRQRFKNNRKACFVHWPSYRGVQCGLRSRKPEGMRFDSEETAMQALDREELVLVHQFMRSQPVPPGDAGEYQQTPVEDEQGPLSDVPISRHRGQTFRLPTRISSVQMLCRRFDRNLHRYYQLPGYSHPQPLYDLLHSVASIEGEENEERLYFGKIEDSYVPSGNPQPYHIRMTKLISGPQIRDFYLKQNNAEQESKGITREAIGRYVLFWARITQSGIGYCAEHLGWGEYASLPDIYTRILDELSD